jgi:O-acetyl-ADP-ribose deacetylase (regulator of RNase III)
MKIIYRKGNLLDTDCMLIGHGCNAQGKMNSGVAKAIRSKYPDAYKDYMDRYKKYGLNLGDVIPSVIYKHKNKIIVNCITQEYYGRDPDKIYVSYNAIQQCMKKINHFYASGFDCIGLPKIGAGLGGGAWSKIEEIIERELTNIQPIVYEL